MAFVVEPHEAAAGVKAQLLPLVGWRKKWERWIERLPRALSVPILVPLRDLKPILAEDGRWLATGVEPLFELRFEQVPSGWYYLETALHRSMGSRVAQLHYDLGQGVELGASDYIPSNLRGSVRELVWFRSGLRGVYWQPCASRGYFTQAPLVFYRITWIERVLRMAERVYSRRSGTPRIRVGRVGLVEAYLADREKKRAVAILPYREYLNGVAEELGAILNANTARSRPTSFVVHVIDDETSTSEAEVKWAAPWDESAEVRVIDWRCPGAQERAMEAAAAPAWHILLRDSETPVREAFRRIALHAGSFPRAKVIYSDHDFITAEGQRHSPIFKPDWDTDLYYSHDYLACICAISSELEGALEVFVRAPTPADWVALVLRASTEREPREVVVHLPQVLCHRRGEIGWLPVHGGNRSEVVPLLAHAPLSTATIVPGSVDGVSRVIWPIPQKAPRVSVIIPTRDQLGLLQACISSIVERTTYANYEILVIDNDSTLAATHAYLRNIQDQRHARVLKIAGPFNYSALNNAAVQHVGGDCLLFLNNDTEVIDGNWMTHMVRQAIRPDVGVVGARLLYSDGTIQHAGVVLGLGGVAGHIHRFLDGMDHGYCGRASIAHNFSAVTGACAMVRRDTFLAVGGFDAQHLAVAFNDVDLCIRIGRQGLRTIYEPAATLYHHESMTRGVDDTDAKRAVLARERAYMLQTWHAEIANDPAFNINLSRDHEEFVPRTRLDKK